VLDESEIPYEAFKGWSKGVYNPTAPSLERMAIAGYDIHYILTGEKKNEN
jgi:hypothetical protein